MTEGTAIAPLGPPLVDRTASAPMPLVDVRGVGVLVRLVAYLLDALLLALGIYVVVLVLHAVIGPTARITDVNGVPRLSVDRLRSLIDTALATAVAGAYFVGSWLAWGGTPAQRLVRARVERADGGGRLALGSAIKRWLLLGAPFGLASTLLLPVPWLGAILVVMIALWHLVLLVTTARDRRKRGIHDRVAGSIVLRRQDATA
jgi:RDD family